MFFDKNGHLHSPLEMKISQEKETKSEEYYQFVKTQFAPPEIHISIVSPLQFFKKRYISNLTVEDEGDY